MAAKPAPEPLFLTLDAYHASQAALCLSGQKLQNAYTQLEELATTHDNQEDVLTSWYSILDAIQEQLISIDRRLFEAEQGSP